MAKTVDDLLGTTMTFARHAYPGTVMSTVRLVAYDPERGWKLWSAIYGSEWVPLDLFKQLQDEGILL